MQRESTIDAALERTASDSDVPEPGQAWLERAGAYADRNELGAAGEAYDRAFALGVSTRALHVNRSIIAQRSGDGDAALRHAQAAVVCDPASAAAQINAAIVEGVQLGHETALARLDAAVARLADSPGLHRVQAYTLVKLGRFAEALAAAERAIALDSRDPRGHEVLVMVLKRLGRDDDARAALDRPEILDLGERLRVLLAVTLMEAGRRDEARDVVRIALERNPQQVFAWFAYADIGEFASDGSDIAAMERLVAHPALSVSDRIMLHFALGKALLARREHAAAFAHFRTGNERKRRLLRYDVVHDERVMADLAAEFPAAAFAAPLPGANRSERPVFVVGLPRSGTSLVEQLLASHGAVFGAGELLTMAHLAARRHSLDRAAWPSLAQTYLDAAGEHAGDALRVVDKLPLNFLNVGFIRMLFANARIIHCRRRTVDSGLSCYLTLFDEGNQFSYDLTDLGRFIRAYEGLMAHWRSALPSDRFLEVDYEAVVDDVETQARRLVAFCGLPWDDAVLRFYETERAVRTASKMQVRQPIYRTSVDRAAAFGAALDPLRRALAGQLA